MESHQNSICAPAQIGKKSAFCLKSFELQYSVINVRSLTAEIRGDGSLRTFTIPYGTGTHVRIIPILVTILAHKGKYILIFLANGRYSQDELAYESRRIGLRELFQFPTGDPYILPGLTNASGKVANVTACGNPRHSLSNLRTC